MLDNLRGMAVFASVVGHGSFSGAAKDLGITTSAVSQQIRSLEEDVGVVLLYRSTRKLSLTEAGESFYKSCQDVVTAAEQGKMCVNQLRDDLAGVLRISTTPELGVHYVLPALTDWIAENKQLQVNFIADNRYIDMIDERIDIAVRMSINMADSSVIARPLMKINQLLVGTPDYIASLGSLNTPKDLANAELIAISLQKDPNALEFLSNDTSRKTKVKISSHIQANNLYMVKSLVKSGKGLARIMAIDIQEELDKGELAVVLPQYHLPVYTLYAVTLKRDQQPVKITRCLEVIQQYFSQIKLNHYG